MSLRPPLPEEISANFGQISDITLIGSGGFKFVYEVHIDGEVEALKLVKVPKPTGISTEEAEGFRNEQIKRISRELSVLEKCSSPEIVRLGNLKPTAIIIDEEDYIAYSEEFLEGNSLRKSILSGTQPTEVELKILLKQLLKAIKILWALGIVHRDIKPENIMKLDNPERPFVLIDLGIAFSVVDTPLTINPYQIPGTARYIAPEMFRLGFRKSIDFRSDLYAAGLTIYEYASGIYPFAQPGDDIYRTFYRIEKEKATSLKVHRADLSDSFVLIIDQLLRKKPALRPSNIEFLIRAMEVNK